MTGKEQEGLFEIFKQKVAEILRVKADEVTDESRFVEDLHAGSIDFVEIVITAEKYFDIKFAVEELDEVNKVGDLLNLVRRKLAENY